MKKTTVIALSLVTALFAGQALAAPKEVPTGKGPGGHGHERMFDKADTNKDGVVTKEEFRAHSDKIFAKLDKNGDGKITKEERDAAHKEHQAKREEWKAKKEAAKKAE